MKHTITLFASLLYCGMLVGASAVPGTAAPVAWNIAQSAFLIKANDTADVVVKAPAKRVIYGKVVCPTGPLPGAVVKLASSKQTAVTNSNGEFRFTVPADSGPMAATASYAGYVDVPVTLAPAEDDHTVQLTTPHIIKVGRKQQLKKYMKSAHRQVRRTLRKV